MGIFQEEPTSVVPLDGNIVNMVVDDSSYEHSDNNKTIATTLELVNNNNHIETISDDDNNTNSNNNNNGLDDDCSTINVVFGEDQEILIQEEHDAEELLKHQDDLVDGDALVNEDELTQITDDNSQASPVGMKSTSSPLSQQQPTKKLPIKDQLMRLNELLEKAATYTAFLIEDGLMTEQEAIQKSKHNVQNDSVDEDEDDEDEDDQNNGKQRTTRGGRVANSNGKRTRSSAASSSSSASSSSNAKKPKTLKFVQPRMMSAGGEMRHYQLVGMNWLVSLYENGVSGILADEMGLGKTIQTISLICHLFEKGIKGPFVIVAPLSTLSNWRNELSKWAPGLNILQYHGNKNDRARLRNVELPKMLQKPHPSLHVLITSYEMSIRDARFLRRIPFKYLVVDEAHRLKNFHCKLTKELKQYQTENRLLLTGTPLQNNLTELWSLLNFLMPDLFDDLENFRKWFDVTDNSDTSLTEERTKLINKLHTILRPFILRRLKTDVELDLPTKKEYLLFSPMEPIQKEFYEAVLKRDLTPILEKQNGTVNDNQGSTRLLNIIMQLRKVCNHPYLLSEFSAKDNESIEKQNKRFLKEVVQQSGKFRLMHRMLTKLKERGHKVLIFSLMTRMLDVMEDYLEADGVQYCRLDGSVSQIDRENRIKQFNEDPDITCFLLSTRAGGLGINLTSADTVIIYDSDWNPQIDLQAQDRCHRIGQTKPVRVFRLLTTDSVEKRIWQTAQRKLQLEKLIIHKGNFKGAASTGDKITLTAANLLEILNVGTNDEKEHKSGVSNEDLELLLDRQREDLTTGSGYEVVDYQKDNFMTT